jgi:hypothetical protein
MTWQCRHKTKDKNTTRHLAVTTSPVKINTWNTTSHHSDQNIQSNNNNNFQLQLHNNKMTKYACHTHRARRRRKTKPEFRKDIETEFWTAPFLRRPATQHKMLSQRYPNANCTADNCFLLEDKRTERGGGRSHDAEIRYREHSRKKWKGLEKGMGRRDAWRHKLIMSQDEVDMAQYLVTGLACMNLFNVSTFS